MKSTKIATVFVCTLGSLLFVSGNTQAQDTPAAAVADDAETAKSPIDWKEAFQKRLKVNQGYAKQLEELQDTDDVEQFLEGINKVASELSIESNIRKQLMMISAGLDSSAEAKPDADEPKSKSSMTFEESKSEVEKIAEQLAFEPKFESEIPALFAMPTPVGEIEVKHYKSYRMAKTPSNGRTAFFRLFNHIKENDIKMTSPVQMTYEGSGEKMAETEMAFLYPDSETDGSARQDSVEVMDTDPMTVISMGMRGRPSAAEVEEAAKMLREASKHFPMKFELKDEVRLLGYNSPAVPKKNQFYEVQIEFLSNGEKESQPKMQ